jgi:3-oxoacyl-[acyl-carrier protein] reductase
MQNNLAIQRVALITGGAMGIGATISKRLAQQGSTAELRQDGLNAKAIEIDISNVESVSARFSDIEKTFGRCDVLVNSAGIAKAAAFLDVDLNTWNQTMNVNVTGTMLCGQFAAKLMIKHQWGRIVNLSSISGIRASQGRAAYGTSKAAIIGLTRQMAIELAPYGITVNSVAPGPVDTPMTRVMHTEKTRESFNRTVPMQRYGSTEEIASAVAYLVSDEASYITGHTLPVDGGFTAAGILSI